MSNEAITRTVGSALRLQRRHSIYQTTFLAGSRTVGTQELVCALFLHGSVFIGYPELIILTGGALGKVVLDVLLHMESALEL